MSKALRGLTAVAVKMSSHKSNLKKKKKKIEKVKESFALFFDHLVLL